MRRWIAVAALAIVVIAVAAAVAAALTRRKFMDPESARCNSPRVIYGAKRDFGGHEEIPVQFSCAGALIAGTINLPSGRGPHPAVVWVHGAGAEERLPYEGAPLVQTLVRDGVAVLSYDKRGVGGSHGECCPGDHGHFNLLAADADGAVATLRPAGSSRSRRRAPRDTWRSSPLSTPRSCRSERRTSTARKRATTAPSGRCCGP